MNGETPSFITVFLFVLLPFFCETNSFKSPVQVNDSFTVVIDAGHGGKDSGALGSKTKEKDITLKLALRLGKYLEELLPDTKVIYTRRSDVFIPLHERTAIANNNHADIFFSIHCNALPKSLSKVRGTETYVMGLHKSNDNLNVAKRENESVLLEQNFSSNYNGFNPNSSEGHIMLTMAQNAYLSQSLLLAEKIEGQFKNTLKRPSRGVKQAGFVVLSTTTMPSVLVETGFLTNNTDENYLLSEKGQVYTASAMYRAIKEYKHSLSGKGREGWRGLSGESLLSVPSIKKEVTPFSEPTIIQEGPSINEIYPNTSVKEKVYKVQLASSPYRVSLNEGIFKKVAGLECIEKKGSFKYVVGNCKTMEEAIRLQNYWRKNGFKDAFIISLDKQ